MAKFITSLPGIGGATAAVLNKYGFRTLEDLANASPEALSVVPGFRAHRSLQVIEAARASLAEDEGGTATPAKPTRRTRSDVRAGKATVTEAKTPKTRTRPARASAVKEAPVPIQQPMVEASPQDVAPDQTTLMAASPTGQEENQPSPTENPSEPVGGKDQELGKQKKAKVSQAAVPSRKEKKMKRKAKKAEKQADSKAESTAESKADKKAQKKAEKKAVKAKKTKKAN